MTSKTPVGRSKALPAKRAMRTVSSGKSLEAETKPPKASRAKSPREKQRAYRERMRKRGMKLLHIWVPDTHTPEFIAQAHRESVLIASSQTEADDQAFIDSVSWWNSEEAAALWEAEGPEPWWRTKEASD